MRQSLGQFDAGAFELVGEAFELGFQPFEEGEGIGGGARKAGDDMAIADAADFARIAFDDGLAERDLTVAGHRDMVAAPDAENGCAVPTDGIVRRGGCVEHPTEMVVHTFSCKSKIQRPPCPRRMRRGQS